MSKLKSLTENTLSTIVVNFLTNLISLITLPLFVRTYGNELYGIYLIGLTITGSLVVFDFGITRSIVRFTAEYSSDKDVGSFEKILSVSAFFFLFSGLIFPLIFIVLAIWGTNLFNIAESNVSEYRSLFYIFAFFSFFNWIGNLPKGILEGFQLFKQKNIGEAFSIFITLIVYILLGEYKISIKLFSVIILFGRLLPTIYNIYLIKKNKLLDGIHFKINLDSKTISSNFFQYSKNIFILALISFFSVQVDKYVLATICSVSVVTIYTVITKPAMIIRMVNGYIFLAVGPMIARENKSGNINFIKRLFVKGNMVHGLIIWPISFIAINLYEPFLRLWIGGEYLENAKWGMLYTVVFILTPFYGTFYKWLINSDGVKKVLKIDIVAVSINFGFSVFATYFIGIGGVIIGTVIQAILQVIYYLRLQNKIEMSRIEKSEFFYFILAFIINIFIFFINMIFIHSISVNSWKRFILVAFLLTFLQCGYSLYCILIKNVLNLNFQFMGIIKLKRV